MSFAKTSYPDLQLGNNKSAENPFEVTSSLSPEMNRAKQPVVKFFCNSIQSKSKVDLNSKKVSKPNRNFVKSKFINNLVRSENQSHNEE